MLQPNRNGRQMTMMDPASKADGKTDGVGDPGDGRPIRLSELLMRLARSERKKLALGHITRALRDRGFGALMLLLAIPNLVPLPPGTSTVFGIPLILVALQLIIGYRRPLLPRVLRMRELPVQTIEAVISRVVPWLERFERLASPRLWILPQRQAEQLIGIVALLMGVILVLPIPFANFLPGIAVVLMSLGLGERDGAWVGAGLAAATVSTGIAIAVFGATGLAIIRAL